MTSQAQAQDLRSSLTDVLTLFIAQLLGQWRGMPLDDVAATRKLLLDLLPDLVDQFGRQAGTVAADWYTATRDDNRVPDVFAPDPVVPDIEAYLKDRADSQVNWATTPLSPEQQNIQQALERVVDSTQTEILKPARQTVLEATKADPGHPRWARVAQIGCCAFCALLASRGPVYYDLTKDFRTHNACRCVAVPSWESAPLDPGPEVATFEQAYRDARRAAGKGATTAQILAEMRKGLGVR